MEHKFNTGKTEAFLNFASLFGYRIFWSACQKAYSKYIMKRCSFTIARGAIFKGSSRNPTDTVLVEGILVAVNLSQIYTNGITIVLKNAKIDGKASDRKRQIINVNHIITGKHAGSGSLEVDLKYILLQFLPGICSVPDKDSGAGDQTII